MFRCTMFMLVCLISQAATALDYTLEMTEQEIQTKIAAFMPLEIKKYFVTVKISDPKIDLIKETNEIGLFANIEANTLGGIQGKGKVMIKGTLQYDVHQGAFYFNNPTIINLAIDNVPESMIPKVQNIAQVTLANVMAVYPVYQFKDDNLKHNLAKAVLKSLEVKNETLLLTLSAL